MKWYQTILFIFSYLNVHAQIHDDIKYLTSELYTADSAFLGRDRLIVNDKYWEGGVYFIDNFSQKRNTSFYNARPGLHSYVSMKEECNFKKFKLHLTPSFIISAYSNSFNSFPPNYPSEYWLKWANYINKYDDISQSTTYRKFSMNLTGTYIQKKIGNKNITLGFDRKKWTVGVLDDLLISENAPAFLNVGLSDFQKFRNSNNKFIGYDIFIGGLTSPLFGYPDNGLKMDGKSIIYPKERHLRGISGFNLFYERNGNARLKLGINGVSSYYLNDSKIFNDILPGTNYFSEVLSKIKSNSIKMGSVYVKSSFKDELLDIWFQYGLSNSFISPKIIFSNDTLLTGYLVGARKRLKVGNSFIEFFFQQSNLVNSTLDRALRGESWYTSNSIRQGYSNGGMVIGNGVGPGGVSTYISGAYISKNKSLGVFAERLMHNQDLFYSMFNDWNGVNNGKYRRHWMDLSLGFYADFLKKWRLHHFAFTVTKAFNYQWQIKENWPYFFNKYGIDKWGFNIKYQVILNNPR